MWGLIILNCTIKTRMIYFGVAKRYKAQKWRIFESKTRTTIFRVQGKREEGVAGASQRHQIKLHTSCDVPAPLNHLKTTVVNGARSIFALTVVVIYNFFELFCELFCEIKNGLFLNFDPFLFRLSYLSVD